MTDTHASGATDGATDGATTAGQSTGYVEVDHLSLGYRRRQSDVFHYACADLDFNIARGEFVVIVGTSGCGKTTFLEALAGLVPVAGGEMRLGGETLKGPGRDRSLVFQSPSLYPWMTVRRNVEFSLRAQEALSAEDRRAVDAMIELVGLRSVADLHPHELSGGMKQRVNLARALVTGPEVLLLDEPFGALDAQTREAMQFELVRVWQAVEMGEAKTAVFVTHDVEEAVFLADRVLVFSKAPAKLAADIRIDLPRPRMAGHKRSPEFLQCVDQVLSVLYAPDSESDTRAGSGADESDAEPAAAGGAPT